MLELADVISDLRDELDRARRKAEDAELRFGLGPVELEVSVVLDREGKAGGKIKFWIAEVSAEGKVSSTSTQRIKLTLNPTLSAASGDVGQAAAVPSAPVSVYVGGTAMPRER